MSMENLKIDDNVCYEEVRKKNNFTAATEKLKSVKLKNYKCFLLLVVILLTIISFVSIILAVLAYSQSVELKWKLQSLKRDVQIYANVSLTNSELALEIFAKQIANVSSVFQDKLAKETTNNHQGVQILNSCASLSDLSPPTTSGLHLIRSSNDYVAQVNCTLLTINNIPGWWRRIAYLMVNDSSDLVCPNGLELWSDPPSCRSTVSSMGCSSVIYTSNGISYSQIYGRINAYPFGTPDGFLGSSYTIDSTYVDGVSLTYGSNPRKHVWTFAASHEPTNPVNCDICSNSIPSFPGNNYTCDTFPNCGFQVCSNTLWTGGSCPPSNGTFYRQLPEPTTDDIEMRICRDQENNDEDFLITLVELYVL